MLISGEIVYMAWYTILTHSDTKQREIWTRHTLSFLFSYLENVRRQEYYVVL